MSSAPEILPRVILIVVAQARYDHWPQLEKIEVATKELVDSLCLTGSRYQWELKTMLQGGSAPGLATELDEWLRANVTEKDRLIFYWTGHATRSSSFYFLLRNSPRTGLGVGNAIMPEMLADAVGNCRAEKKLFFIDTCYSGDGADVFANKIRNMFAGRTYLPGQVPYIGVFPSSHSLEKAQVGIFCRALREVLTADQCEVRTEWDDGDEWISAGHLRDAVYDQLQKSMGEGWQEPPTFSDGRRDKFIPNPRYRQSLRLNVETTRRLAGVQIPEALRLAGRSVVSGETGLFFTGRKEVREKLATWLGQPEPGLAVLTGPPGAGKSAVLGRLLLATDPQFAEEAAAAGYERTDDVPMPPGCIGATVHVRGKTEEKTVQEIAAQFFPASAPGTVDDLLSALRALPEKGAIVVDALDEASAPYAVGSFLRRLVEEGGCRVLIGSRRSPDGRTIVEGEERHARLRKLFGEAAEVTDLEDDGKTSEDIAAYVRTRLGQPVKGAAPGKIDDVAEKVAGQAEGSFLYARIVARTLTEAGALDLALPAGPIAALEADIQQRFPDKEVMIHDLFRGLAWAEGEGVSRRSWPALATALTQGEREFTDEDVVWILEHVGWHILQVEEDEQAVFRLIHQAFTDHYRKEVNSYQSTHQMIAWALAEGIQGLEWLDADAYVHRYLAVHARRGGVIATYVQDPGYLVTAKAGPLICRLYDLDDLEAERAAEVYRRAVHGFLGIGIPQRMALLELAAKQNDPAMAEKFVPTLQSRWRCVWTYWRPKIASVTVAAGYGGFGPAVSFQWWAAPDATTLLIAGRGRELRVWELGQLREMPQSALLDGNVTALKWSKESGGDRLLAGTDRGELAMFSLPDLQRLEYRKDAAKTAIRDIAVCRVNKRCYVCAVAEGATVHDECDLDLWTLDELKPVASRKGVAMTPIGMVVARLGGKPVIITCGDAAGLDDENPIRIWSVPGLDLIESFGNEGRRVERIAVVAMGKSTILLGTRFGQLLAWNLDTKASLSIQGPSEGVTTDYFMPIRQGAEHAEFMLNNSGQLSLLTLRKRAKAITLEATGWVETEPGRWLGAVPLWRGQYLVSLRHDIKVWNLETLRGAIKSAPASYNTLYQWQLAFGFNSITGHRERIFAVRDSMSVLCFDADSGGHLWFQPLTDTPRRVRHVSLASTDMVVVATQSSIVCLKPEDGSLLASLAMKEEVKDMQLVEYAGEQCLAVLLDEKSDYPHYHRVAMLRLPGLEEIKVEERSGPLFHFSGTGERHYQVLTVGKAGDGSPAIILGGERQGFIRFSGQEFLQMEAFNPWGRGEGTREIRGIAFTANESFTDRYVAGTNDGAVVLLEWSGEEHVLAERQHGGTGVVVAVVTWCGRPAIASGSSDGKLRFWSLDLAPLEEIELGDWINEITSISSEVIAVATLRGVIVLKSFGEGVKTPIVQLSGG